jgi:succinate-semialdehyde dehydrogenase / glutarate-semialdehyde dehydrogenase
MSQQDGMDSEDGGNLVEGPSDPEHDPRASFAVEPQFVQRLVNHVVATSGESHTTYAPFTGQPIATLPQSSTADIAVSAARAGAAQLHWSEVPLEARAQILLDFHDVVLDRQAELLDIVQWESGKARIHAFEEIAHVAMTARYYGRTAREHLASRRTYGIFPLLTRADVHHRPKGVVGVISPWNYPLTMALCDGIAAVLAGNTVLHKPDLQTPLSALLGVELLYEAGLPDDVWQVVLGEGGVAGPAVIDNADYVCFTGSTATGKSVAQGAARRLIGASLELGGKNPMLILADANLDRAAEGAVRACFSSAGQLCVSMERMYVADQIYDRFLGKFLARVNAMRLSTGLDFSADMGSMISERQLATTVAHVEDAKAKGARVLTGGHARPDVGPLFYAPTVLTGVQPGMSCFADETFGPVVSVYRFNDENEAVDRANDGPYGLNASIFTRDGHRGRALAARLRCGTVNINEGYAATFGSVATPMGGMRDSGLGRRQGAEGILRFTETQSIATQRGLPIAPTMGISAERYAWLLTGALRVLHKARRP